MASRIDKQRQVGQLAAAVSPTDRVLEYLRSLDEVTVHKEVIFPLLRAMQMRNVEYVHGPDERGKDIKFNRLDEFESELLDVCQVKNQPFSGNAAAETNTFAMLNQLRQCRSIEILNPATNRLQTPDNVWLISTYPLPDKDTIGATKLFDDLAELSARIVWPDKLVTLIRRHLPAFYDRHTASGEFISHRLLEYLDQHHESRAFDTSLHRKLSHFFVNLAATPRQSDLNRIGARQLAIIEPIKGKSIEGDKVKCLNEAFTCLPTGLLSEPFLEFQESPNLLGIEAAPNVRNSPQGSSTLKPRTSYVRVRRIRMLALLDKVENQLAALKSQPHGNNRIPGEARAFQMLSDLSSVVRLARRTFRDSLFVTPSMRRRLEKEELEKRLPNIGRKRSSLNIDPNSIHFLSKPLTLPPISPATLLQVKESLVVCAGAGAGKTSLARMIAIAGLNAGLKICYFPCSRYTRSHDSLQNAIEGFLQEIAPRASNSDVRQYVEAADLFLLDGCDEAATFGRELASDIQGIVWKPKEGKLVAKGFDEPFVVPQIVRSKVSWERSSKSLAIHEYLFARERQVLVAAISEASPVLAAEVETQLENNQRRVIAFTRASRDFDLRSICDEVRVRRFSKHQLHQFFKNWFAPLNLDWSELWKFLSRNDRIRDVCRTPLVATIVGALYERNRELPKSRTDVYSRRFDLLLGGWDAAKDVRRSNQVSPQDKRILLTELAYQLHVKHRRTFTLQDFSLVWKRMQDRRYRDIDADEVIEELRVANSVVVQESSNSFTLGHLSFQEFLAAEAIVRQQLVSKIAPMAFEPWWREVAKFMVGLVGDAGIIVKQLQMNGPVPKDDGFLEALRDEARYSSPAAASFINDLGSSSD